MKVQHSPGPWVYKPDAKMIMNANRDICSVDFDPFEDADVANAQLMTQAPDLLTTLENLITGIMDKKAMSELAPIMEQGIATIMKARGYWK